MFDCELLMFGLRIKKSNLNISKHRTSLCLLHYWKGVDPPCHLGFCRRPRVSHPATAPWQRGWRTAIRWCRDRRSPYWPEHRRRGTRLQCKIYPYNIYYIYIYIYMYIYNIYIYMYVCVSSPIRIPDASIWSFHLHKWFHRCCDLMEEELQSLSVSSRCPCEV